MKNKLKSLIISFVAVVFGIFAFASTGVSYEKNSFAASPVSVCSNAGDVQSQEFVISSVTGGSKTFYLYKNSDTSTNSAKALFSYYYGNAAVKGNDSSDTELLHSVGNGVVSKTVEGNGQFVSTINLSNNIIIAMNNGYITNVSASAAAHSLYSDNWAAADEPETITMSLYVYDANSDVYVQANDVSCKTTDISQGGLNSSVSGFDSKSLNTIALSFRSKFTNAKNSWGISSTTGKNYMKVQNPTLTLSSTDTTLPTITASANKTEWSKTNSISISASDSQSGIFKIEVSKDGGNTWEVVAGTNYAESLEYKTESTATYDANQNGTYLFKVTDNVGNEKLSDAVVISNIDTNETTAEVSLEDVYTSKTFNFASSVTTDGLSPDYLYYTYEFNGVVSEKINFANGSNAVSVAENGTYKFTFYAYDEATFNDEQSEVVAFEKEVIVDDTVYSVNITYQNAKGTESFTTLRTANKTISFEGNSNNAVFYQLIVNGTLVDEVDIVDGTYTFDIAENYEISVLFREQIILSLETSYTYNKTGFTPSYTVNIDGNYDINWSYFNESTSKEVAAINGIGTYTLTYEIENDKFIGSGSVSGVVVNPKTVELSNIQTSYKYSAAVQELVFTSSESLEFVVNFTKNGESVEFLNAGDYEYLVTLADNEINKNYSLSVSGVATISAYVLTITETQNEFVYDKTNKSLIFTTDAPGSLVIDEVYKLNGTQVDECVNVAIYTVELSTQNENYVLEYSSQIKITKRAIEVKAVSQNLTYGEVVAPLTYTVEGALDVETLLFTPVSDYSTNAGTYVICILQQTTQTDTERELFANYDITYTSGTITIHKKSLTVVPGGKQTKVYGETDPVISYSVSGLLSGDELSGSLSREVGENVGYYNITVGTLQNVNYAISIVPTTFQIVRRIAFVSIEAKEKVYGDADPALSINATNSNILSSDIALFEANLSREEGENVGTYKISISKTGLENYVVIGVDGTFEIIKKQITVTANPITTVYGTSAKLSFVVDGLVGNDELSGSLSREPGENIGYYNITVGSLSHENYNISYVGAVYHITPKQITIYALQGSKVYGDADNLEYSVEGAIELLEITLLREVGENVGTYQINGFVCENENYAFNFVSADYQITKAELSVSVLDATKQYLLDDPIFETVIVGAKFEDEFIFEFTREVGENVGEYEVEISNADIYLNYNITLTSGILSITKRDVDFVLKNKTVVYSGIAQYIDAPEFEFDVDFVYTYFGSEIEDPTNAGTYTVKAYFAGNENYNAFESNEATLVIEKKLLPITIKNTVFTYNGNQKFPGYQINLDTAISFDFKFENNIIPVEVGEYNFSIVVYDPNYYSNMTGILKIVDAFFAENETGTASVSSSQVGFAGLGVEIYEVRNSSLLSMFTPFKNNRSIIAAYGFKNVASAVADDNGLFTVTIRAPEANEGVKIYTVDENGKATAVSYTYANGEYVFTLNSLSGSILITESNMTAYYAKIVVLTLTVVGSVVGFSIFKKKKKIKFMNQNTTFTKIDEEELKNNSSLVVSKINDGSYISRDEIISN